MSLIAVVDLSHPELALTPTIRTTEASIRVVSHTATDPETGMFFFLVETDSFHSFEAALDGDTTVADSSLIAAADATRIYRLQHTPETKLVSPTVTEMGGLVLEAESTETGWSLRLQLPDRTALGRLWEHCNDAGIEIDLDQIYSLDDVTVGTDGVGLTDAQRTALVTAYERGYFEEPRESSLQELAEELGISPTAVGGRIRRGTSRLVERTLIEDE